MWLWVGGLGLFVSFPLCGAGFNLLGGPPPLLPGARWPHVCPAVPVCGVLVRRLPGCAEGAVTKKKRSGCLPTGTGKRAGLCVLCARCV